jgi:predicted amino acid-binding ACT domain protein
MTTENLAMLAVGQIIAAGMFALGVLVGCSLQRKDAKDDSNSDKAQEGHKDGGLWHRVERR